MEDYFERLARDLASAWTAGDTTPLPAEGRQPTSRAQAYAVQDRMAELIGGRIAGWKVGATVRAVQLFEGHDGPLPGRVFADRSFSSPAQVPFKLFRSPKVECEFAFRLNQALPPGRAPITADQLAPLVTFHPAIEIAAYRYAPGTGHRALTTYDGIADNGGAGGAVLGDAVTNWRGLPFETMPIDARIDGSDPIQMYSGAYRRDPLTITAETLSDLRERGVPLEAGMFVLTGSLSLPTAIRRGQTLVARFADLAPLTLTMT